MKKSKLIIYLNLLIISLNLKRLSSKSLLIIMLNNKTIFISGGTGSFGSRFTSTLQKNTLKLKKLLFSQEMN